ncbi:DeoR/GlpR family DNA-binding transcription regulator [Hufsiella ginkgonis]|uniref:DeoR family transcriptional regulator n=1 Tax=Hufsiella ginkgonis TaxID=2695274 RepID=A0A7K1XWU1_9SPHI|nr:DeoR/GlpR family DNA-binding transcription regulator [Hufsiella ginkgonis]MXV15440.1 DeoR family transcriptional regulator [Hufsiella ginkgonis]
MLKKERHAYILRYLALHTRVVSAHLAAAIRVSDDTIRRDLRELADQGKVITVHGGALVPGYDKVELPVSPSRVIAGKILPLLAEHTYILTGGGEPLVELAAMLPADFKATLLSVSMKVAAAYSDHPSVEVILIGDKIVKSSKLAIGGEAIARIRQVRADICLVEAGAIDPGRGLMEDDWETAQVKKAMIESADKVVCITAPGALARRLPVQVCGWQKIDYLVTELDAADPCLNAYRDCGTGIL